MQLTGYKDKNGISIRVGHEVKAAAKSLIQFDPFLGFTIFSPLGCFYEKLNRYNAAQLEVLQLRGGEIHEKHI